MSISAKDSLRRSIVTGAGKALAGLVVASFAVVGGCTVGPDFEVPKAPVDTHYTNGEDPKVTASAEGVSQQLVIAEQLPADWWRLFDSPKLDEAIRAGLSDSPTIAIAEATLRKASDELRSGQGVFYPQIGANLGAEREHPSPNSTPARLQNGTFNLFTLSTTISYALDMFGGERRSVEALSASVDYQKNAARAASLALASNIANAVIASAAYSAQIKATNDVIGLEKEQVRLAGINAQSGTATYAGMLSLQAQLQATEALIPPLKQKLAQSQDLLAVLMGKPPSELQSSPLDFGDLTLPRTLPLSLPSALVRQRPDIQQAEANLHAASAQIGVAAAAMLPSITLGGSVGFADTAAGGLLTGGSSLWSLGVGIAAPIFDGGTLSFQRKAAVDAYDAASASYRQTVLTSFQQVADTLEALAHDADALAADQLAVQTSARAAKLVDANYRAGLATYSEVLIADVQYQQAQIAEIEGQAGRYQDTVALFVALGGGWWNAPHGDVASIR